MLFALGIASVPVSAHFTLGELTPTYDYHNRDFDPHMTGPIGYVWPGVGLIGTATLPLAAPIYPGYQSPYPGSNPGTKGSGYGGNLPSTTYYPPGWYQLDANNYAPFGAILTSNIAPNTVKSTWWNNPTIEGIAPDPLGVVKGDLIFAFNATKGWYHNYTEVVVFVPPEFTGIKREQIVASWTNNYDLVQVKTAQLDRNVYSTYSTGYLDSWGSAYAPGWTAVRVGTDRGAYYNVTQKDPAIGDDIFYYPRCLNWTRYTDQWYYLRINDVTAPTIAGRYFFKVGFKEPNSTIDSRGTGLQGYFLSGTTIFSWMPIQNWPVLAVKGEIDPAIMTGTIRIGGWNSTLYGDPVELSGRVRAVGIADDPYTGKTLNRYVEARGYFNQTAEGHYEVEGVAPGVYDVYASCAGYPEQKIAAGVKILKGQSYHIDGYLYPGAVVHGTVYSKCGTGEVMWAAAQYMKIEIYSLGRTTATDIAGVLPTTTFTGENMILKPGKMPVTWSPWAYPKTRGTLGARPIDGAGFDMNAKPSYTPIDSIQFPWTDNKDGDIHDLAGGTTYMPGSGLGFDPWGVGPSQSWLTSASSTSFSWQFGDKGKYGAPCDWTGHVPEINATWVNGLAAGSYSARAWTLQYVQMTTDGSMFEPATFSVASAEWPGDIEVQFDLRLSSKVTKVIHLHDVPGTLVEASPLPKSKFRAPTSGDYWQAIYTRGYLKDAAGTAWGYATYDGSAVSFAATTSPFTLTFKGYDRYNYYGRSYGLPPGDYKINEDVEGFIQDPNVQSISLGLCGTPLAVSNHAYRGVGFNVSIVAKDWQHPTVDQKWKYDDQLVYVAVYKEGKQVGLMWTVTKKTDKPVILNITNWISSRTVFAGATYAFDSGIYSFKAFTYGYVQKKPVEVSGTRGAYTDIPIKLTQGAQVPVIMRFKHESIYTDAKYNGSMRVRLFDDKNALVAEYLTSDPWHGYLGYGKANFTAKAQDYISSLTYDTAAWGYRTSSADDVSLNYVPGLAKYVTFNLCGLPDTYGWITTASSDPAFEVGWEKTIMAPYGIDAAPNYMGGWSLEVDFVPWYQGATTWPMPIGALTGESPKYIPVNHLGPWELRHAITVPNNHLGGEASIVFELDLRGSMTGQVQGYTWCDDWRSTSWAQVVFAGADGKAVETFYTADGQYGGWLPTGQYTMTIKHGGYVSPKVAVFVSDGGTGYKNFPLERSNIPIPEFPVAAVVLAFSLAASLVILRRRRK